MKTGDRVRLHERSECGIYCEGTVISAEDGFAAVEWDNELVGGYPLHELVPVDAEPEQHADMQLSLAAISIFAIACLMAAAIGFLL